MEKKKFDRCSKCFWNSISIKTWSDFECKPGENKEQKIQLIKNKKCQECKKGKDNYSEIWKCIKCGVNIDGHQYFWHNSLCASCWEKII